MKQTKEQLPIRLVAAFDYLKSLPPWLYGLSTAAVALTIVFVVVSETNHKKINQSWKAIREVRDQSDLVDEMRILLLDAETGQRGYLLTGNEDYLSPLTEAKLKFPLIQARVVRGFMERPDRQQDINQLGQLMLNKFIELETTVSLARMGKRGEAIKIVDNNSGKEIMQLAKVKFTNMQLEIDREAVIFRANMQHDMLVSRMGMMSIALLNIILLAIVVYVFTQDLKRRTLLVTQRDDENRRLSELVADRTSELNDLTSHLQNASERERAALARDLHDELGGILTTAKMDLDWLQSRVDSIPGGGERLAQVSKLIDEAITIKRRVIENLRPSLLDNLGLTAALEWYVSEHCAKGGLKCTLNLAEDVGLISPDASIALFRIVQESTTNVLRHAKAKSFAATLHVDQDNIHLILEDDGTGLPANFNPAKLSHGLSGIRQRARALGGNAVWKSSPGNGTAITVIIPRDTNEKTVSATDN